MKAVVAKILATFAGIILVVPFVAAALIIGSRAMVGANSMKEGLLLLALATGGALISTAKDLNHHAKTELDATALRIEGHRQKVHRFHVGSLLRIR